MLTVVQLAVGAFCVLSALAARLVCVEMRLCMWRLVSDTFRALSGFIFCPALMFNGFGLLQRTTLSTMLSGGYSG